MKKMIGFLGLVLFAAVFLSGSVLRAEPVDKALFNGVDLTLPHQNR
jgi:hypothetical protein